MKKIRYIGLDVHKESITIAAAEVGDLRRFATAGQFMSYVGLVPSESSSGERRRQGSITRAGNSHLCHILVEAAWHYRYRSAIFPSRATDHCTF